MMNLKSLVASAILLGITVPSIAATMDCCCCKDKIKKESCEKKMKSCDENNSSQQDIDHSKMPTSDSKDHTHTMPMNHSDMKMPMDHSDMKMPATQP